MPEEIGIESPIAPRVIHEPYPDCRALTGQQIGYISVPRSRLHSTPIGINSQNTESSTLVWEDNFDNAAAS
jgi:hypothetical protein